MMTGAASGRRHSPDNWIIRSADTEAALNRSMSMPRGTTRIRSDGTP